MHNYRIKIPERCINTVPARIILNLFGYCYVDRDDPAVSGGDMTDAAFRADYSMNPTDVSHLNFAGHKLVLPKFEKFIADTYSAAKAN